MSGDITKNKQFNACQNKEFYLFLSMPNGLEVKAGSFKYCDSLNACYYFQQLIPSNYCIQLKKIHQHIIEYYQNPSASQENLIKKECWKFIKKEENKAGKLEDIKQAEAHLILKTGLNLPKMKDSFLKYHESLDTLNQRFSQEKEFMAYKGFIDQLKTYVFNKLCEPTLNEKYRHLEDIILSQNSNKIIYWKAIKKNLLKIGYEEVGKEVNALRNCFFSGNTLSPTREKFMYQISFQLNMNQASCSQILREFYQENGKAHNVTEQLLFDLLNETNANRYFQEKFMKEWNSNNFIQQAENLSQTYRRNILLYELKKKPVKISEQEFRNQIEELRNECEADISQLKLEAQKYLNEDIDCYIVKFAEVSLQFNVLLMNKEFLKELKALCQNSDPRSNRNKVHIDTFLRNNGLAVVHNSFKENQLYLEKNRLLSKSFTSGQMNSLRLRQLAQRGGYLNRKDIMYLQFYESVYKQHSVDKFIRSANCKLIKYGFVQLDWEYLFDRFLVLCLMQNENLEENLPVQNFYNLVMTNSSKINHQI